MVILWIHINYLENNVYEIHLILLQFDQYFSISVTHVAWYMSDTLLKYFQHFLFISSASTILLQLLFNGLFLQ